MSGFLPPLFENAALEYAEQQQSGQTWDFHADNMASVYDTKHGRTLRRQMSGTLMSSKKLPHATGMDLFGGNDDSDDELLKAQRRKEAAMKAMIDLSHLPKDTLLKLAHNPKPKLRGAKAQSTKGVRRAAKAAAQRRIRKRKKAKRNGQNDRLPPLAKREYELKFELEAGKVYVVPVEPKKPKPRRRPQRQLPAAPVAARTEDSQRRRKRRAPAHAQLTKLQRLRLRRQRAAGDIQRVFRGFKGRRIASSIYECRNYAKALTQRAQAFEAKHGWENWMFWMDDSSSSETEPDDAEALVDGDIQKVSSQTASTGLPSDMDAKALELTKKAEAIQQKLQAFKHSRRKAKELRAQVNRARLRQARGTHGSQSAGPSVRTAPSQLQSGCDSGKDVQFVAELDDMESKFEKELQQKLRQLRKQWQEEFGALHYRPWRGP